MGVRVGAEVRVGMGVGVGAEVRVGVGVIVGVRVGVLVGPGVGANATTSISVLPMRLPGSGLWNTRFFLLLQTAVCGLMYELPVPFHTVSHQGN